MTTMRFPHTIVALFAVAGAFGSAAGLDAQTVGPDASAGVAILTPPTSPLDGFRAGEPDALGDARVWPIGEPYASQSGRRHTARNMIVGGVIGGAVGILTCTAISNATEDEGGFHTCTWKGNAAFGLSGAAVGALVGLLVS